MADYDAIDDFSPAGRQRLLAERGEEIRWALDAAFTTLIEAEPNLSLARFGFHDDVGEAVEWSMRRFADGDIDPARLHAGSRSFRLFTEARFWLCQKVGRRAYDRILAEARAGPPAPVPAASDPDERGDLQALAFGRELSEMLPAFLDRTCADMVGFWLEGTQPLRRDWFGWRERGELSDDAAGSSKKQRSLHAHDAMFRFLCCLFRLIPAPSGAGPEQALELTCLSGCPNRSPYRVPDREVIHALARFGVRHGRDAGALRKRGATALLGRCLDGAERRGGPAEVLARSSLSGTTPHALGIENDIELRLRLERANGETREVAR